MTLLASLLLLQQFIFQVPTTGTCTPQDHRITIGRGVNGGIWICTEDRFNVYPDSCITLQELRRLTVNRRRL